jgi:hypothetical protein
MTLHGCHWSMLGVYRNGGAIGFGGAGAHGVVPHVPEFASATEALTLAMVLHRTVPNNGPGPAGAAERASHFPQ